MCGDAFPSCEGGERGAKRQLATNLARYLDLERIEPKTQLS